MLYSYAMGVNSSIYNLEKYGFVIERDNNNFKVTFPENKKEIWEEYIKTQLKQGFWNDYISENNQSTFIFHLENGFKKYEVDDFKNDEVLSLCEKLCCCKFDSLEKMFKDNKFYKTILC